MKYLGLRLKTSITKFVNNLIGIDTVEELTSFRQEKFNSSYGCQITSYVAWYALDIIPSSL